MYDNLSSFGEARRKFIGRVLPVCAAACLGGPALTLAEEEAQASPPPDFNIKEMFRFSLQAGYIPLMKQFIETQGREFLDTLKEAYTEIYARRMEEISREMPVKNIETFSEAFGKAFAVGSEHIDPGFMRWISNHMNRYTVVERTDKILEIKVTQCAFADVCREVDAAEIGYITHCHPDFVLAEAFDPKMKLYRTNTLMQGDDHCNHRYVYEG